MPEREFDLYLSVLSRLLRLSPQQKDAIADELRDHLEERFEALVRSGVPRDDAIRQALDEFGDAAGLAVDFTAVSKKRIRRLIMRSTAAVTALIALVAFFLTNFAPQQPGAPGLAGPAFAAADSDAPETQDPVSETEDTPGTPPLEPLAGVSGPPLLPRELESWTTFEFTDTPLRDAARFISDMHNFPVVLDAQAFEDAGLDTDLPITIHVVNPPEMVTALAKDGITPQDIEQLHKKYSDHMVPLHQALTWLLRPHGLTWYVEDDVLHITTEDGEPGLHIVRSYSIRHLMQSGIAADALSYTIQGMTYGEWMDIDGAGGTMSVVGQVLTVRHSYQMHRQVESLLAALAQRSEWQYVEYPRQHVRQLALLEQRVDQIEFVDTPLSDVIEYVSQVTGAWIRIDSAALADEGMSGDEPVTLNLSDRPLRTALKLVLAPLQLAVIVKDGVLTVTTSSVEFDDPAMHTVVYDVRDVESALPAGQSPSRLESLVDAIQKTTGYWINLDGDGGDLRTPGGGRLVVRQTDTEHRQIRSLLTAQRRLLQEPVDENAVHTPAPNSQVETRFYRIPTESADDLLSAIPELVAPDTWTGLQFPEEPQMVGMIRKVALGSRVIEQRRAKSNSGTKNEKPAEPSFDTQRTVVTESVLIIRNTRTVHLQIDEFLNNIGLSVRGVLPGKAPSTGGGFF